MNISKKLKIKLKVKIKKWYNNLPENEKGNLQLVVGYACLMAIFTIAVLLIFGGIK